MYCVPLEFNDNHHTKWAPQRMARVARVARVASGASGLLLESGHSRTCAKVLR